MMLVRIAALAVAAFLLGGCLSNEERAQQAAALRAQQESDDDAYCKRLTARPGTDAYVNCRVAQDSNRIQQQQATAIQTAASQAQQARNQATTNALIYGPAPAGCSRGVMGAVVC